MMRHAKVETRRGRQTEDSVNFVAVSRLAGARKNSGPHIPFSARWTT
jgi:hypothetical protein